MSRLILLSGPSGVGKTTVSIAAADRLGTDVGVSHTTRPIRPGEVDGESYHFVPTETFLRLRAQGALMEHTEYPAGSGTYYGLARSEWRRAVRAGRDLIVVMEPNGVRNCRAWMARHADASLLTSIFLMPKSYEELAGRMAERGDDPEQIAVRLEDARQMILRESPLYEYTVLNPDGELEATVEAVCRIVRGVRTGLEVVR